MMKTKDLSSIPPLLRPAEVRLKKQVYSPRRLRRNVNGFADIGAVTGIPAMSGFAPVRQRVVARTLGALSVDSTTGPEGLRVRLLKECARVVSLSVTALARMMLARTLERAPGLGCTTAQGKGQRRSKEVSRRALDISLGQGHGANVASSFV